MNTATLRRLRPRGHTRRAQVLDAATKVFIENGYGAATIDLVVSRAGASKATIYSFFGGKEGLFTAIIEERAERVLAALPHVGIDHVDVRTTLIEIGRRYMRVAMSPDAIGLYRLILAEGVRFPQLARTFLTVATSVPRSSLNGERLGASETMAPKFRSRFAQPSKRFPIPGIKESSTVE